MWLAAQQSCHSLQTVQLLFSITLEKSKRQLLSGCVGLSQVYLEEMAPKTLWRHDVAYEALKNTFRCLNCSKTSENMVNAVAQGLHKIEIPG